jgi:outer membrane lipoprotein SlyB
MLSIHKAATRGMAILAVAATAACSSTGGLGNILGSVLGQGQGQSQVSGTVQSVNTRNQQLQLQQSNGQNLTLTYDNQTQVVYQNQNYSVNNLEYGDRVTARIANTNSNNSTYYTDFIQVDQSVSSNTGTGTSTNVQPFEGTARNIDRTNGTFQLTGSNYGTLVVTLPYNPRQADVNRFNNLRAGDYVRIYGVLLNNNRVELRQFN